MLRLGNVVHSDNDEEFEHLIFLKDLYACCCTQRVAVKR